MIGKSLLDAFSPGLAWPSKWAAEPREPKAVTPSEPAEEPLKDRLDLTSPQGGFRSFSFQFRHLAIRRETAAVRSATRENVSVAQQEKRPARVSSHSVQEARQTELSLFYARTQTISVGQGQETADHLQSTSQGVGRTFEVSISLDASFLHQFVGQSETFASGDQDLFEEYLSATDRMVDISGEAAQGFFDMVSQALDDAQSAVMDGLDEFLTDVGASFGLEGDALTNFKSQVAGQVAGFFSDLDRFISDSRTFLQEGAPSPEPPPVAPAVQPPQDEPTPLPV
jgi:hypothetical protein